MVDVHVSMSEVARRLRLTLPAVSNWRRRHSSFPVPMEVDGQELFSAVQMAGWLDDRRIPKKNLGPDELPGTTYGTRFRNTMEIAHRSPDYTLGVLWEELVRLCGAGDIAVFADLVLTLLYVAIEDGDRWSNILAADGPGRGRPVKYDALYPDSFLLDLHRGSLPLLDDVVNDHRLAEIVRLIERVRLAGYGIEVFEFLLDRFAAKEGRRDLAVRTPPAVVRLLVELADTIRGTSVFDPCCGSGEFLVGAARHIEEHGGRPRDVAFSGRALSVRAACLARMNLRLRGVSADVNASADALFHDVRLLAAQERFEVVLSNPPFDLRAPADFNAQYGRLPKNRTSLAWLQYVMLSLSSQGRAAVVMPGGTLFRSGAEQQVRTGMVEDGVVEAIIALPPQLFASTAVPVNVWLLRAPAVPVNVALSTPPAVPVNIRWPRSPMSMDEGEILFIDASGLGHMISRAQRILSDDDRRQIVDTVNRWREGKEYEDMPGFSASVAVERVRDQDYVLVPARYVNPTVDCEMSTRPVHELRSELVELERHAASVNAVVEQKLDGLGTWIR
ncbi:N-6 DNA methylase [Actinophytocola sp.]|uniref:N-6 DNA methylase n=1 Tax=Actinophytocola sp. TaxID=1872138 RepID=UPI00389A318D